MIQITCFNNRTFDASRALGYGFVSSGGGYEYVRPVCGGQFLLAVRIDGGINTTLTDTATGEPYTLHLVEGAGGEFVGHVRAEF